MRRVGGRTNQITILELHEFVDALVFVNAIVVCDNALAIDSSLDRLLLLVKGN